MIEYTARSGPPEAQNCPAFICDACRSQVVDRGNIYWVQKVTSEHYEASPIFVGHKGRCGRAVEALIENRYPASAGWSGTLWEELSRFLQYLTFNARNSFSDDAEGVFHDHKLVQPNGEVLPTLPEAPDTRRRPATS